MKKSLLLILLIAVFASNIVMAADSVPDVWVEPSQPEEGDTITFYCEAPGAVDVEFKICSEDACYQSPLIPVERDGDIWHVEIKNVSAGEWHYNATVIYPNGSVPMATQYFTVEKSEPVADTVFPIFTIAGVIGAGALLLVSFWAWRRHNS